MNRHDALRYLRDLGWNELEASPAGSAAVPTPAAGRPFPLSGGSGAEAQRPDGQEPLTAASLHDMAAALRDCRRCPLSAHRFQVVFGVGPARARVMLVGEAPGGDEDRMGEPFVGRAGQLLNAMLAAIGLDRKDVYIANVVKCRPPNNRDPEPVEVAACLPFLLRQVELVDPEVVVTLGRVAALHVVQLNGAIRDYRGRWVTWQGRPLLPIFHPAYLLRNPAAKAVAWRDLKALRRRLDGVG